MGQQPVGVGCNFQEVGKVSHAYTEEDALYVLEHYHEMYVEAIAENTGIPSGKCVTDYARRLRQRGRVFKHTGQMLKEKMQPLVIRDGYDTVPWFMRQSTRNQGIPDLQYMT